jgi:hypothetical protein
LNNLEVDNSGFQHIVSIKNQSFAFKQCTLNFQIFNQIFTTFAPSKSKINLSKPHHIFLIIADSLRKDSVYATGSPELPYTEAHSTQFTQARSSACWTLPATACLFTGMDVHEHGADTHTRAVNSNIPMLAEKLRKEGYTTIQVTANQVTTEVFGLDRGFDVVHKVWKLITLRTYKFTHWALSMAKPRMRKLLFSKDALGDKMAEDMEGAKAWGQTTHLDAFDIVRTEVAKADKTGEKCFFFINLMETHFPYHIDDVFKFASEGLVDKVQEGFNLFQMINQTFLTTENETVKPKFKEIIRERQAKSWTIIKDDLDNFIKEMHEDKNNLIAFCSDHGDNFGEMGWYYHFSNVNEAGNRVPLFWLENGDKTQKIIDTPISSKFIHQSIMEKVGVPQSVTLFKNEEQNFPIIESYWYAHTKGTLEKYRYNQFLFSDKGTRYLLRNDQWLTAPVTDMNYREEKDYQPLPKGLNPIEEAVESAEKKKVLKDKLKSWTPFSDKMLKK